MINVQTIQLLAMGGVAGGVVGFLGAIPYLKSKGVNVEGALNAADKTLQSVQPILNIAEGIAPLSPVVNIAKEIVYWAKEGVQNAEQLYHIDQTMSDNDRLNVAKNTVYTALKEINITPTENQQRLINDTILAAVNRLGHKDPTEAEKVAAQQALQAQVAQLTVDKAQLQNTINTITTAATAVNTPQPVQTTTQQIA